MTDGEDHSAHGAALLKFEERHVRPREGRTLIVGSRVYGSREDRRLRYRRAVGIDMVPGDGVDRVVNLEEPIPPGLGQFSHIECMSVLEHSARPWLLAANIERLMKPGATLFLTVPFVWRFHSYPGDYYRYTAEGVRALFPAIRWRRLMYASDRLRPDPYLRAIPDENDYPCLQRCEVVGFGQLSEDAA